MRISDWSSDVCSSDLPPARRGDVRSLSRRRPEPGPDRQMVRGARGEGTQVDAGRNGFEVGRGEDAVEPCHRAAAVKAVAGVDKAMAGAEIGEAAAVAAPFVAVAPQDRRSEERRVGKECGSRCRYRGAP